MPIRRATPEDLASIRVLEQKSETAAHWGEPEYQALFAPDAPARLVIVAANDGDLPNISGFAVARCGQDEWEIENVVVDTEKRRLGIGTALVDEILRQAYPAGAVLLEVRESNCAARFLYEKLGFSEIGRRPGYYQDPLETALILRISVTDL